MRNLITFLPTLPIALGCAVLFRRGRAWPAYALPVFVDALHHWVYGFSPIMLFTSTGLLLCVVWVRRITYKKVVSLPIIIVAAAVSAILFHAISNLGVWVLGGCDPSHSQLYPHTLEGLARCYRAGLPFFAKSLLLNVLTAIVFMKLGFYVSNRVLSRTRLMPEKFET